MPLRHRREESENMQLTSLPVLLVTKRVNQAENLRILFPGRSIGASLDVTLELFVAIKHLAL